MFCCVLSAIWLVLSGLAGYSSFGVCYRDGFDASFATLLMDSGHWREAFQMLEARRRAAPHDAHALLLLARAAAGLGDTRRCAEVLATIPDASPLKPDALLREGQAQMQWGDALRAESAWTRCVDRPDASRETKIIAWSELALLYGVEDRQEDLRGALWERYLIADDASKVIVLRHLLDLNLVREEPAVRAKKLEAFVGANDQDVQANTALGLALLEANELERGMDVLRSGVRRFPASVDAWRGWLRAIYQQGDLEKLATELDRAPEGIQQLSGFWKLKAIALQDRGEWPKAAECIARAIEISPFEPDLHSQLAVCLARLNDRELAEEHGQIAKRLRSAQSDLRTAYEDLMQKSISGDLKDTLAEIAARIAQAYRTMGFERDAEAWNAVSKTEDD